ncbi:hypothetical protein TGME49_234380 [Toxoplasma gondii ME49]|uniref:Uncharacterized protein n=2 Tax=Toxoplasma gondii TaxID=5811 RepID=A0A086KNI2_TOXGO|nr:hypothetical protein TGME49_234380 [Toxoplasma gondii ME49]EPT26795.1 hypothetical protein TGME49_234380 [Toxoplasma gondii ME49]KFG45950.1 hypothetical protein TGDOM2_234380 [Toxoplasma gondii GAB2-2007-GAL-DOM2]|eukprot:XP_018635857.1 hypothetical protein TGME49_234380 [Toxoplasma gondii ME49]
MLFPPGIFSEATAFSHKRSIRSISSHSTFDDVTAETDEAPVLAEVEKMPAVVKKVKHGMRKVLESLGILDSKCEQKKKHNKIPSAAAGDSPIKTFGYPFYDTSLGRSLLRPQVGLSFIEGFMQPIKVGAFDWMVQGTVDDVLSFLVCFDDYEAIAEKLGEDGAWHSEGNIGPLYLQLQNTSQYQGDASSILMAYSVEQILGRIDTWGVIDQTIGHWWKPAASLSEKAKSVYDTYQSLKERVPDLTTEKFQEVWNSASTKSGVGKLKELAKLFTLNPETRDLRDSWENLDRVDRGRKISLYVTSYPKRSRTMATFAFGENRVKLGDMAAAVAAATKDSTLDNLLKKYV